MNIIEKMQEFNILIDRHIKAENFFNSKEIPNDKKLLALDSYQEVYSSILKLESEIRELGYTFKVSDYKYGIGRTK